MKIGFLLGLLAAMGVMGTAGYFIFYEDPLQEEIREIKEAILRLEAERRVAEIVVSEQSRDPEGRLLTRFSFTENGENRPKWTRNYEIKGDVAYFDALVVKFDREFIKLGDGLRGRSLYLFRRVFGESQAPQNGAPLDPCDTQGVPAAYRTRPDSSPFERQIWAEFWNLALHPEEARQIGIRVAQGEAVYTKLLPGKRYTLSFEDTGALNIVLSGDAVPTTE